MEGPAGYLGWQTDLNYPNQHRHPNSVLESTNVLLEYLHKKNYQKEKSMSETHTDLERKIR
jgi:hypothetical protein